ncbi:MAG TPA: amino acid permease [Gemmatimonadaceae bacterium]|nr:amino acid permease [Gemmatimonadaceae bacterium]
MDESPTSRSSLPRELGLWSAVAVVIGSTIGSGIFRTPAGVANRLPGPAALSAVWVAGGLLALCGALTLAEVAGAFPDTGGIFVFIQRAWGRLPAFLFGWSELTLIRAASLGAISTTFAEYLMRVLGLDPSVAPNDTYVHYIAAVAIALTATFNYVGMKTGSLVQNITTIAKYFGLLFIIVLALAIGLPRTGGHFTPVSPPGSFSMAPFGLALVSVLWAYDGWADLTFVAGEVKDPRRNLPRALIIGSVAVIVIYLLANIGYLSVMSVDEVRNSPLVAADVAARLVGSAGVAFVSITVMLSTFGTLNGTLLTSPRVFFAMADEGLLFKKLAAVHPKYQTPYVSIVLVAALGVVFVLLRTFEQLADTFVTAILPFYLLGVASIFVFRARRTAEYNPPFRTPLYPITPVLFVLATLYLLVNALIDPSSRWATMAVFGVILVGIPVYYGTVGRPSRRAGTAPLPGRTP